MLTDNQLKLIDDLKMEFCKMNMPIGRSSGGLINKAAIDSKFAESDNRRAQLQAITDATHKAVMEMMDMDMERLNKDLIPMGMVAKRSKTNNFYVYINRIGDNNDAFVVYFQYLMSNTYEGQPDGKGFTYYTGFNCISWSGEYYKSIDDLCKNRYFIGKIEDNYRLITKNK